MMDSNDMCRSLYVCADSLFLPTYFFSRSLSVIMHTLAAKNNAEEQKHAPNIYI